MDSGDSGHGQQGESVAGSSKSKKPAPSQSRRAKSLEAEVAEAQSELQRLGPQIKSAERQLKALRHDRRMHGLPRPSDKEQRLDNRVQSLKLRRNNIRRWIARSSDDMPSGSDKNSNTTAKKVGSGEQKKKGGKAKSGKSTTKKKRSKGSTGRKKAARVARDSPSRGISSTGRRSRARLIG